MKPVAKLIVLLTCTAFSVGKAQQGDAKSEAPKRKLNLEYLSEAKTVGLSLKTDGDIATNAPGSFVDKAFIQYKVDGLVAWDRAKAEHFNASTKAGVGIMTDCLGEEIPRTPTTKEFNNLRSQRRNYAIDLSGEAGIEAAPLITSTILAGLCVCSISCCPTRTGAT